MTTKTPESLLNEAFISEDVCMESLRSVIQKHNERVREALHELDQLRARVSELEAENARLRLAAIEDAKEHDRRVTECERWADTLAEVERERDEAKRTISVVRSNEALADTEFEGMRKDKETAEAAATELAGQLDDLRQELKAMEDTERRQRGLKYEAEQQRDAATEALKRARVAIEKAPHPSSCDGWRAVSGQTLVFRAKRCDCWKTAALHDLAAAETDK